MREREEERERMKERKGERGRERARGRERERERRYENEKITRSLNGWGKKSAKYFVLPTQTQISQRSIKVDF